MLLYLSLPSPTLFQFTSKMFIQKSILNTEKMNMSNTKKTLSTSNHPAFFQYLKEK